MWTKKDSFADLEKCLNWQESKDYVENLTTGGHSIWRMPLVREYGEIYDNNPTSWLWIMTRKIPWLYQVYLQTDRPIGIGRQNMECVAPGQLTLSQVWPLFVP
jgi:hypothetical protein